MKNKTKTQANIQKLVIVTSFCLLAWFFMVVPCQATSKNISVTTCDELKSALEYDELGGGTSHTVQITLKDNISINKRLTPSAHGTNKSATVNIIIRSATDKSYTLTRNTDLKTSPMFLLKNNSNYYSKLSIEFRNLSLSGNTSMDCTAPLIKSEGTHYVDINNTNIRNNTYPRNTAFTNGENTNEYAGGGIFASSNTTLVIRGTSQLYNNRAGHGGGAIRCFGNLQIYRSKGNDPKIYNNESFCETSGQLGGRGGNIYIGSKGTLYISDNAQITNGLATSSSSSSKDGAGGNIYVSGGIVNVNNGTITNGNAGLGGGIFAKDNATVNIEGGSVNANQSEGAGGNIYVSGGTVNVNNGTITKGNARHGGGIYATSNATINLWGGKLTSNQCRDDGEGTALYFNAGSIGNLNGGTIEKNNVGNSAVNVIDSDVKLTNTSIINNDCNNTFGVRASNQSNFTMLGGQIVYDGQPSNTGCCAITNIGARNKESTINLNGGKLFSGTSTRPTKSPLIRNGSASTDTSSYDNRNAICNINNGIDLSFETDDAYMINNYGYLTIKKQYTPQVKNLLFNSSSGTSGTRANLWGTSSTQLQLQGYIYNDATLDLGYTTLTSPMKTMVGGEEMYCCLYNKGTVTTSQCQIGNASTTSTTPKNVGLYNAGGDCSIETSTIAGNYSVIQAGGNASFYSSTIGDDTTLTTCALQCLSSATHSSTTINSTTIVGKQSINNYGSTLIKGNDTQIKAPITNNVGQSMTIQGGYITNSVNNEGILTMSGGTITTDKGSCTLLMSQPTSQFTATGGTVNRTASGYGIYITNGTTKLKGTFSMTSPYTTSKSIYKNTNSSEDLIIGEDITIPNITLGDDYGFTINQALTKSNTIQCYPEGTSQYTRKRKIAKVSYTTANDDAKDYSQTTLYVKHQNQGNGLDWYLRPNKQSSTVNQITLECDRLFVVDFDMTGCKKGRAEELYSWSDAS